MSELSSMRSNIWKYYLFYFFDSFLLYLPFIVYYFQDLGFSLTKITIMSAATTAALLLMEIPSGYIADRIGRRNSLALSILFHIISMAFLYFSASYSLLVIAHIFLGFSMAFWSGADTALLYDILLVMKKEKEYKKYHGKALFFAEMGIVSSSLTGSLLIKLGFTIPYTILFTLLLQCGTMMLIFTIKEPSRHKITHELGIKEEIFSFWKIIKESVYHRELMGIFIYSFIVMGVLNLAFLMYQPYFRETKLPLQYFGVVFALFSVFAAVSALKAHDIERKLGVFYSLLAMPLFLAAALLGAGIFFAWFGFIFFFFRELMRGFVYPVLADYTNKVTTSERRATVLSIGGMFSRVGYTVIVISFAFFTEMSSMRTMFIVTGAMLALMTGFIAMLFGKVNKKS